MSSRNKENKKQVKDTYNSMVIFDKIFKKNEYTKPVKNISVVDTVKIKKLVKDQIMYMMLQKIIDSTSNRETNIEVYHNLVLKYIKYSSYHDKILKSRMGFLQKGYPYHV